MSGAWQASPAYTGPRGLHLRHRPPALSPAPARTRTDFGSTPTCTACGSGSRPGRRPRLGADQTDRLMLAVNEVATNAVEHGGGHGRIRMWIDGDVLVSTH
ncbi:hypothetical protein [Nonomuraea dietziae]|uniref:hypothetical protein n=1 Tax=Nonomuraea dietziae TaxID=65515 RepID=UPI0031E1D17D